MRVDKSRQSQQPLTIKTKETKNTNNNHVSENVVQSPANPALYGAYNNISFRGKSYDGTHFREDLQKRAQKSTRKFNINGEETQLTIFKTKHSEYVLIPETNKLYKIKQVCDKERINQQVLASKLYQSLGIRTPEYIPFEQNGATGWLVEVFEEELFDANTNKKALYESFIADVWLGNTNGLCNENTKIDQKGNPVKMSVSGSLGYRASGKQKSQKFDYDISIIESIRDASKNPDAAKVLANMKDEELYEAIRSFNEKTQNLEYRTIVGNYNDSQTLEHNISNLLDIRKSYLERYITQHQKSAILEKRGLTTPNNSTFSNLRYFNPNDTYDIEFIAKITDEEWEILQKRKLLVASPDLKPFTPSELKSLAQMTDEEHQNAIKHNLYKPNAKAKGFYGEIGANEISLLSKLKDEQWINFEKRNLLEIKSKYNISGPLAHFVQAVVDLSDEDWKKVIESNILNSECNNKTISEFIKIMQSDEAKTFVPSFIERAKLLYILEKQKEHETPSSENITYIASCDNDKWQRVVDLTHNFTHAKFDKYDFEVIFKLDDNSYNKLKSNGVFDAAAFTVGIENLVSLSDEEWKNFHKRNIVNIKHQRPHDWAFLAELTDEEWSLVVEKHLLENRSKNGNSECFFNGETISKIVHSLSQQDWENVAKRELINKENLEGDDLINLAKLSDNEFEKYKKIIQEKNLYQRSAIELAKLDEEQFNRVLKRNLLQYINCYESWDNWEEDVPITKMLAELSDSEYASFRAQKNNCKTIAAKTLIIKAEALGLDKKQTLSELNIHEKRKYLQLLIEKSDTILDKDFTANFKGTKLVPTNQEEYNLILSQLIKSVGIDTTPICEAEKVKFFSAIDYIGEYNSEFKTLDLKNPEFQLSTLYPREEFKNDIYNLTKNLDKTEQAKIWDYLGFELSADKLGNVIMSGYPQVNNDASKLAQITNPETKIVIEQIKPFITKFTSENKVLADGEFISEKIAQTLNDILSTLPELYSIIGKKQHSTQDYSIDVHSLAVLQECISNPNFENLTKEEKHTLILTSLLHDITKEELSVDKSHPTSSAFDAYYILKKLNLPEQEHRNIYQLIKNHDFLEKCNKAVYDYKHNYKRQISDEEQDKLIQQYAYEFRSDNLGKLACILTEADLKSVKRNGEFYFKYADVLDKVGKKLDKEINKIKATSIPLPQTKIPKASKLIADGKNIVDTITTDENGNEIKNRVIYMQQGLDLSQYGFEKGVNADNFNVMIHGFDTESQQTVLEALELADQNALLSTSYVIYQKGNYYAFRPQGVIKEVQSDEIGVAYYRDFGSGYKKTTDSLVNNYINGNLINYRRYFSDLVKKELKISDEEYIELYEKIKNKPLDIIEQENPKIAKALNEIFAKMEVHKRRYGRNYNEILVTRGENKAVYFVGKKEDGTRYEVQDIPEFLRKYAQDNDLPIIYFGE